MLFPPTTATPMDEGFGGKKGKGKRKGSNRKTKNKWNEKQGIPVCI